jgi:hypothetical protein
MKILRQIFGRQPTSPFRAGDRVRDPWGNKHTVIETDPKGENGLGAIRTRSDDGVEHKFAMVAHGLTSLAESDAGPADPKRFEVKRVKPNESSASAYLRGTRIILLGTAITNYGGLGCAPFVTLKASDSDAVVGGSLIQVLKDAMTSPIPTELSAFKDEYAKGLQGIGIAPANKLSYGAVNCSVSMTPDHYSILPTNRERGAFMHLPALTLKLPLDSSREQIGKALRDGFSRCT